MTMPATAGPTTRAPLNTAEFKAMALMRSFLPTICTTKDCRAGRSRVLAIPYTVASTATCQYWMWPAQSSAARAKAWSMRALWVRRRSRRLCTRSASAPARKERKSIGPNWSAVIMPSLKGEPVISRTTQACPTLCIHVPTRETSWPHQKRRKSR